MLAFPKTAAAGRLFRFWFRWLGLAACLALSRCSLSIENPSLDAKDKLAKVIPTTMAALVGRWKGDSTFTVDDTRATALGSLDVLLEIFSDTSYSRRDASGLAFTGKPDGSGSLIGDTLIITAASAAPDTFIVKLRFLGNYLELDHPADQRYTFFHKIKFTDSSAVAGLLKDSLWRLEGRRFKTGVFQSEAQIRNFTYATFPGDSMRLETHSDGLRTADSGKLARSGSTWTWNAGQGRQDLSLDLIKEDSLRIWPLREGRRDSGFYLYVRASRMHRFDIDISPLLGHMRCDSLLTPGGKFLYHYGRYYDWTFGIDHKVAIETNMAGVPMFNAWTLDSGWVELQAPGLGATRFKLDTAGGAKVIMAADSGTAFAKPSQFCQTKVDTTAFRANPLERFQSASYFQAVISGDTTDYFFNANNFGDRFEIATSAGDSADWVSMTLEKGAENFSSGQSGFIFALQSRNARLGRYTCRATPALEMVIRQPNPSAALAEGTVQGLCQISKADSAFADSTLAVDASFRIKRKNTGSQASPLWPQ